MKIYCPDCGAAIPAGNMNLETALAKCQACNGVFSFRDAVDYQQRQAARAAEPGPELLPRPPRIRVEDMGQTLTLRWRWLRSMHFLLLFFCIAWDSFLIFWYSMAFHARGEVPWLMVVFPIAHVAVGVGLTYTVLTGFLNSTVVEAAGHMLSIRHGPLPWRGNRNLASADIRQLFCDEHRGQNGTVTFNLCAMLRDGRKLRLLGGFENADEPRYLEQLLEQRLRIEPGVVVGEHAV